MADTINIEVGAEVLEIVEGSALLAITDDEGAFQFELEVSSTPATRYVRAIVIGPADLPTTDPTTWT